MKKRVPLIKIDQLSQSFHDRTILHNISLDIFEGDVCIFRGPSGSGKSTFLHLLTGFITIQSGEVIYISDEFQYRPQLSGFSSFFQKHIGTFFTESLFFEKNSVSENMYFPNLFGSGYQIIDKESFHRLICLFEVDSLLSRRMDTLSSGERERVSLIRLFAYRPKILFLDEPFSHLDDRLRMICSQYFQEYISLYHPTVCMITHDMQFTLPSASFYTFVDGSLIYS